MRKRDRELFRRIDRHLDRADERWASIDEEIRLTREEIRLSREQRDRHAAMDERHAEMFQRNTEAFERHAEAFGRHGEAFGRHAETFSDLRAFTRDMLSRMEQLTRAHVKASEDNTAALRELREDSVAHRQALLRVLDRLGPGPGESPSAA